MTGLVGKSQPSNDVFFWTNDVFFMNQFFGNRINLIHFNLFYVFFMSFYFPCQFDNMRAIFCGLTGGSTPSILDSTTDKELVDSPNLIQSLYL